jgi:hypothetical protein
MAKKTYRIAGRGVDEVNNNTSDGFVKNIAHKTVNIPAVVDTPAANTELLNAYQNYGAVSGNPLTQTTQTTTSPLGTTQSQSSTYSSGTKTYNNKFTPSDLTNSYLNTMRSVEGNRPDDYEEPERPGPYVSKYESTINELLDTIKNRKAFDVTSDTNYSALYDQYAERYKAQAQRAMNDAMASANTQTGGYGSSYGQIAGQQAYDRTMEGLNDQNINLMNLAYQMYSDDRANDYNKLSAFQGEDATQYGRYRDDMADWESDRAFGYNQYRDSVSDWQNDRNYYANQYFNSYGNDRSAYDTDRNFDYTVEQNEYTRDDANYQDALKQAMSLAQAGLPVPDYITARINQYNEKYGLSSGDTAAFLQALAAQALAAKASSGSGGSGKSRSSGGSSKSDKNSGKTMTLWESLRTLKQIAEQEGIDAAESEMKTIRKYITGVNNETIDKSFDEFISDWKKGKTTNINKINGNRPR